MDRVSPKETLLSLIRFLSCDVSPETRVSSDFEFLAAGRDFNFLVHQVTIVITVTSEIIVRGILLCTCVVDCVTSTLLYMFKYYLILE